MKIYTKFGDAGETVLFDGARVSKTDLRIETYGTLDELNSVLGLAIADCRHDHLKGLLTGLQGELFILGSDLATPAGSKNEAKIERITPEAVGALEKLIDDAAAQLPPLKNFVLPGGSVTAARLHVARTVCRRAERRLVELVGRGDPGLGTPLIYVNRLSDLLFMLARLANRWDGFTDVEWDRNKRVPKAICP